MEETEFQFAIAEYEIDRPVTLPFTDGNQVVPGWMVAHLGGPEKVIADLSRFAATVTFEEFTRQFFLEAAAVELRAIQMSILAERAPRVQSPWS